MVYYQFKKFTPFFYDSPPAFLRVRVNLHRVAMLYEISSSFFLSRRLKQTIF